MLSRIALNPGLMAESSLSTCRISKPATRGVIPNCANEMTNHDTPDGSRSYEASADRLLCRFSKLTEDLRAVWGAAQR